jgi:flagellum-specific ATP synthase
MIELAPPTFEQWLRKVDAIRLYESLGRVVQVVGLVVESQGPSARIGDVCYIERSDGSDTIPAEVVGFRNSRLLLMPLSPMKGVRAGDLVRSSGACLHVPVGRELLSRVLDGLGRPMDEGGPLHPPIRYPVIAAPPHPLDRQLIERPFVTGVRVLDGCLTIGVGQRVGIFSGSGVGKSTLLGMVARNGQADVNVIALIGERGREVREFLESDLGAEGRARSVVVVATSDEPALVRIKAALSATAIAEFFRDQGLDVLLMMDSVTRFAMAQREVGLAIGEPPSTKGYTPSTFALLPQLIERAGCAKSGSITAVYTVLVEGDDTAEPIADAARSILDGHIVLDRSLTERGHYPPVDVLQSVSRVMPTIASPEHLAASNALRELIAAHREVQDLVAIGAYQAGTQPVADRALERWDQILAFLRQRKDEEGEWSQTLQQLRALSHEEV